MSIVVTEGYFSGEDEARKELESEGLFSISADVPAGSNGPHWHDFDARLYILGGTLNLTDVEAGVTFVLSEGTRALVPARTVHYEDHPGYKAMIGSSVAPAELTQPIDKPVDQL